MRLAPANRAVAHAGGIDAGGQRGKGNSSFGLVAVGRAGSRFAHDGVLHCAGWSAGLLRGEGRCGEKGGKQGGELATIHCGVRTSIGTIPHGRSDRKDYWRFVVNAGNCSDREPVFRRDVKKVVGGCLTGVVFRE